MFHIVSPVFDPSGYGRAGRDYIIGFKNQVSNFTVSASSYFDGDAKLFLDDDEYKLLSSIVINTLHADFSIPVICHITPDIAFPSVRHKISLCYTVWETNQLPIGINRNLNMFKAIFTSSDFSKQAFLNSRVESPISVIPHIIKKRSYKEFIIPDQFKDSIIFFSMFDWHLGKGYDLLLNAYYSAFQSNEDVLLIIKTFDFAHNSSFFIANRIKEFKKDRTAKIWLVSNLMPDNEISGIYKRSDCFVLPSRREAWGLGYGDALANGLEIMAPSIGGHRQFLDESNSYLIDSQQIEIKNIERERSNYFGQLWVESNLNHLTEIFKMLYKKGKVDKEKNLENRKDVLSKFSEENVIRKFLEEIRKYE